MREGEIRGRERRAEREAAKRRARYNPWKPRYMVGPLDEPARYIVLLATDRLGPPVTGPGCRIFGARSMHSCGPFAAVLARDTPYGSYVVQRLVPLTPTWDRWTSSALQSRVRAVADQIMQGRPDRGTHAWVVRPWRDASGEDA